MKRKIRRVDVGDGRGAQSAIEKLRMNRRRNIIINAVLLLSIPPENLSALFLSFAKPSRVGGRRAVWGAKGGV
ncbi:MAG TPA: hypothetical protein VGN88_06460 [Phycisphaerae bacterium]|jgi:hypothetical protein